MTARKWDPFTREDIVRWDDETARTVWKWGGYANGGRRYPGRVRALFHVILRGLITRMVMVPRVSTSAPVVIPVPLPVFTVTPVRVLTPVHLLTIVRSTAPPARPLTPAGRA